MKYSSNDEDKLLVTILNEQKGLLSIRQVQSL